MIKLRNDLYVLLVMVVLGALPLLAQKQASLAGYVADPSGAAVPSATVTVTNTATNRSVATETGSDGHYFVGGLAEGIYNIQAQASGFKATVTRGFQINTGASASLNLKLQLGATQQVVEVNASAVHLQTRTGAVGSVVSGHQIRSLAINGRNFQNLVQMVPGASNGPQGNAGVGHLGLGNYEMNGNLAESNSWMVDGITDLDPGSRTSLATSPAIEAISQFRVETSNYSAAAGQAGGAVINVAIKSGTNAFHGEAYEFLRNDALDARNFFSSGRTPLKLNDFGFTLGGPIKKNKLFFFYSSEWRRQREGSVLSTHTPTALEGSGDFSQSPLSTGSALTDPAGVPASCFPTPTSIDPVCFNPNAVAALKSGVFPAATAGASGFRNFTAGPSLPQNFDQELARVDYNISPKLTLMVHWIRERLSHHYATTLWDSGDSFPTISTKLSFPSDNVAARFTHIISPNLLNEVDLGHSDDTDIGVPTGLYAKPSGWNAAEVFPPNALNRLPRLQFSQGYGGVNPGRWPWFDSTPVYDAKDMITWVHGRHTITFGGLVIFAAKDQMASAMTEGHYDFNGSFTGNSFADFLLGLSNGYSEDAREALGHFRYWQNEDFVEDDFRASQRLTLNLGVRYYVIPHVWERDNMISTFLPSAYNPAVAPTLNGKGNISCAPQMTAPSGPCYTLNGIVLAGTNNGLARGLTHNYYNTFSPRLGFSWDPTGGGTTVIRGGYGISHYRVQGNDIYNNTLNPPFATSANFNNPILGNPAGGAVAPPTPGTVSVAFDPNYKLPTIQQYSLGVQHQFPGSVLLTASYVGSDSTHLRRSWDINTPTPTNIGGVAYDFNPALNTKASENLYRPYRGWSSINYESMDGRSNYNSFQLSIVKRLTKNLQFQAAYTWAKCMTNSDSGNQDVYNLVYGVCSYNRPQLLVVNYVYHLPFFSKQRGILGHVLGGWEWSGITTFEGGNPMNVGLSGPPPGLSSPGLATRPNVNGTISYPHTIAEWFNTGIYSFPAAGFYGNTGRYTLQGPGLQDWDMSFYKSIKATERVSAQLRFEFFNIFNHTNFTRVDTTLGSSTFGQVHAAADPRIMQVGAKVIF